MRVLSLEAVRRRDFNVFARKMAFFDWEDFATCCSQQVVEREEEEKKKSWWGQCAILENTYTFITTFLSLLDLVKIDLS